MTALIRVPRLLVSVRDVAEARRAAAGGADIIDFKEPARGPLGRADTATITVAAEALRNDHHSSGPPLSAALGEAHEAPLWLENWDARLPSDIRWLKLGLAGFGRVPDWIDQWIAVRSAVQQRLPHPVCWIAVAYADVAAADAPSIDAVADAAVQTGCAGLLIDTCDKTRGRWLDYLPPDELSRTSRQVRSRGLIFALAGRVAGRDLPHLTGIEIDIVGVRSAVCGQSDRQEPVSAHRVAAFRRQLQQLAADCTAEPSP